MLKESPSQVLFLKRDLVRRIKQGHPWIYKDSLKFSSGTQFGIGELKNQKGSFLAYGIVDPKNPLGFRVFSTDKNFFKKKVLEFRLEKAIFKRRSLLDKGTNAFRIIHGEGDGLPGLVLDYYNQTAVLQYDRDLFEKVYDLDFLVTKINAVLPIKNLVRRYRDREAQFLIGDLKEPDIEIKENNVRFLVNVLEGQKTGFFLDQRENRNIISDVSMDCKVLNMFSYTGGFSIFAGLGGAKFVTSVDISMPALERAKENWELNNLDRSSHRVEKADSLKYLKSQKNNSWDLIIIDPPSYAKKESDLHSALGAYGQLFSESIRITRSGGMVAFSSCSSHVSMSRFKDLVSNVFSENKVVGRLLRESGPPVDHPTPFAAPEMRYLKFLLLEIEK